MSNIAGEFKGGLIASSQQPISHTLDKLLYPFGKRITKQGREQLTNQLYFDQEKIKEMVHTLFLSKQHTEKEILQNVEALIVDPRNMEQSFLTQIGWLHHKKSIMHNLIENLSDASLSESNQQTTDEDLPVLR